MQATVGVVGASARAAVMSLARAGFAAWAVDLFADRDLKRLAPTARCPFDRYPEAFPELCDRFPPGPVLYTGGLENHPAVVMELARRRPLWGNGPEVLEQVRDPFRLRDLLHGKGFGYPRILPSGVPLPADSRWLRKPLRSAGGLGMRFARPDDELSANHYCQEFVTGPVMSAVFTTTTTKCVLLGVTEQLIGEAWLHAPPFVYAGNVGPVAPSPKLANELARLGVQLTAETGLRGVWGVDFILHDSCPIVLEVNPRYTASVEVIEHGPVNYLGLASRGTEVPRLAKPVVGKAIYFAPHRLMFPPSGPWDADLSGDFDPWRLPDFADIPEPGEVIDEGSPVLTFFTTGSTAAECRAKLMGRAAELDQLLARGKS